MGRMITQYGKEIQFFKVSFVWYMLMICWNSVRFVIRETWTLFSPLKTRVPGAVLLSILENQIGSWNLTPGPVTGWGVKCWHVSYIYAYQTCNIYHTALCNTNQALQNVYFFTKTKIIFTKICVRFKKYALHIALHNALHIAL